MADRWFINTKDQLEHFTEFMRSKIDNNQRTTIEFVPEDRTIDQNALFHATLRNASSDKGDESVSELKRYAKLHFGVPILRGRDEEFRRLYDQAIKNTLTYEEKLEAMDILPVTGRMNKEEFSALIDETQRHFASFKHKVR